MRVAMHPGDKGGCGLYRIFMPARAVSAIGVDVSLHDALGAYRNADGRLARLGQVPDVDVVVFQRPMKQDVVDLIRLLKEAGVAVVVELDDDIERVDPLNQANAAVSPNPSINRGPVDPRTGRPEQHWGFLHDACRAADWMTVSTPSLLRYAPQGRGTVVRNRIPPSVLNLPRVEGEQLRVGWSGTVATHPLDLQVTRGAVARAVEAAGAAFTVVGDGIGVKGFLGLTDEPFATGWVDIQNYPESVTATIDVGIVPLADTAFNVAKSGLKGLEYAALGIPFVASPLPEYVRLAEQGIGILARRPRDWAREITRLLTDPEWRAEVASRGRAALAENDHIVNDDVAAEWAGAWAAAAHHRAQVMGRDTVISLRGSATVLSPPPVSAGVV